MHYVKAVTLQRDSDSIGRSSAIQDSAMTRGLSDFSIRAVAASDAAEASALVQESFLKLASGAWESEAQQRFLADSGPEALGRKIEAAAYAAGAFSGEQVVGFLLMPTPTLLGMLFVHPSRLRQGIATRLWECARTRLESQFPQARTVELNSTPSAVGFYRARGFVPISAEFVRGGARATRMACWLPARALGAELLQGS
jgi:GNAT superfamily N-acetyltransferase